MIQNVSTLTRNRNFRMMVLQAYGFRCAVTRVQLKLVEAAHILPVCVPGSVDDVVNGIALSPTYHKAFDYGLIYLDHDHFMKINRAREEELSSLMLDGGLREFKFSLGKVHLPSDPRQWPYPGFIIKANKHRQIAVSQD